MQQSSFCSTWPLIYLTLGALGSYASKASQHKRKVHKEYNYLRIQQPSLKHFYKGIEGGCTYQECNRKYVVKGASRPSFESDPDTIDPKNNLDSIKKFWDAFCMFSSPYSVVATPLSVISASLLAVEKLSDLSPLFVIGVLQAVVPSLFMAVYVGGLNQLYDIEIDKINKPYRPLASGSFSFATGATIVASCLILSFWLAWIVGSWPLFWALILAFVLGTTYSVDVPLLRWKRYPVLAAMNILADWAFIFPIGFSLHMQNFVFGRPIFFSRQLIFSVVILSFFSTSIALSKDIPDIQGDQAFDVQSFAARFGQKKVFWICVSLIEIAYGVALFAGATSFYLWSKIVTGLGHAILASVLLYRARSVDLRSKDSIASFYMFIWKLLYAEYFLMPLLR